ncbi:hypothetical protein AURDEDRAFT_120068 [Auricularia subglabra TFB-10046 SS5]|nr:hypothetical protein AURDEDRAFT_120068 [Auricularia subglabra TFB-10046 SS5]
MSNIFVTLPTLVCGYDADVSTSSPFTISDIPTVGSVSFYPGQTPFHSPVDGPIGLPFSVNPNMEAIKDCRQRVYRNQTLGINDTPDFDPFVVALSSPTFNRAPQPLHAPPISYTRMATATRLRAEDEGLASRVERDTSIAVVERECRPYSIPGARLPRFNARTGTELPPQPLYSAQPSIAWQPLKAPKMPIMIHAQILTANLGFVLLTSTAHSGSEREVTRMSPIFKTISELQNVGHAYMATVNKLFRMSAIERKHVQYIIDLLKAEEREPEYIIVVERVVRAAIHRFSIDYLFRLYNGQEVWLRDIDLWRSPNARTTVSRYWGLRKTPLSEPEIEHLLKLPQYIAQDGRFLRNMRACISKA